jgi:hypothetical protein
MSTLKANAWQRANGDIVGTPLQILSVTKTDVFSSTSTSYVDIPGIAVSITPSSSSSKILIMATLMGGVTGFNVLTAYRFMRNSTPISVGNSASGYTQSTIGGLRNSYDTNSGFCIPIHFLDSPATTSSITYKIQGFCESGTFRINAHGSDASGSIWSTRGTSTITVMEIQA